MFTENTLSLGFHPQTMKKYTVVVAESVNIDHLLLNQYLRAMQFEIMEPASKDFGMMNSLMEHNTPDILILCFDLQGMDDPFDKIREMREKHPALKILVIFTKIDKDILEIMKGLGVNGLMVKPVNKTSLQEKLAGILGRADLLPKTLETGKETAAKEKEAKAASDKLKINELHIPNLPEVTDKIIMFDFDPSGGSEKLEQLILPDKGLCSDILRIANSAFYGRSGKVKTLKDAITLLGIRTIKNIAIVQTKKSINKNISHYPLFKKYLFELPTLTALIAFDLSVPMGLKKIREELFLPASFRDSGKTILALNMTKQYHDVIEAHHKSGISLSDLEMEVFHTTSNEVGLHVFKVWHMPENLFSIIQNQNFGTEQISSVQDIDRLTRLGEIISRKLLSLSVSTGETEMAMSIMQMYKVPEGLMDAFDDDYYDNIKTHPFMEVL